MSVCQQVKGFVRRHELVGDLFSLLGVALFLASIWGLIEYQLVLMSWMKQNVLLNVPALVLGVGLDVFLIFALLCIGSGKCAESESCFRTFRGRRTGTSLSSAFHSWLDHMEQVGRKHR